MADQNIRSLQRAVVSALARYGLPTPERNCAIQVQQHGAADIVCRIRYVELARRLPWLNLMPLTEHRFEGGALATHQQRVRWVEGIALDSLALTREEVIFRGRAWPAGWPVIPASVAKLDADLEGAAAVAGWQERMREEHVRQPEAV